MVALVLLVAGAVGVAVWRQVRPPTQPLRGGIKLYFATRDGLYLVPETRPLPVAAGSTTAEERAFFIVRELLAGPAQERLVPTLPPGTELLGVRIEGDVLTLDFNRALQENHGGGSTGELATVYSLVNSLVEGVPGVARVRFLIEGEPIETLVGHLDLSHPLGPDWSLVKPSP